jgi:hypothetical protein
VILVLKVDPVLAQLLRVSSKYGIFVPQIGHLRPEAADLDMSSSLLTLKIHGPVYVLFGSRLLIRRKARLGLMYCGVAEARFCFPGQVQSNSNVCVPLT